MKNIYAIISDKAISYGSIACMALAIPGIIADNILNSIYCSVCAIFILASGAYTKLVILDYRNQHTTTPIDSDSKIKTLKCLERKLSEIMDTNDPNERWHQIYTLKMLSIELYDQGLLVMPDFQNLHSEMMKAQIEAHVERMTSTS